MSSMHCFAPSRVGDAFDQTGRIVVSTAALPRSKSASQGKERREATRA
jgi:hypothetical protein